MTREEHYDILKILAEETWQVRAKLLEYMKTVKVEENIPNVPSIEEEDKDPVELKFGPLTGGPKPDYPAWDGPVNWEPQ